MGQQGITRSLPVCWGSLRSSVQGFIKVEIWVTAFAVVAPQLTNSQFLMCTILLSLAHSWFSDFIFGALYLIVSYIHSLFSSTCCFDECCVKFNGVFMLLIAGLQLMITSWIINNITINLLISQLSLVYKKQNKQKNKKKPTLQHPRAQGDDLNWLLTPQNPQIFFFFFLQPWTIKCFSHFCL